MEMGESGMEDSIDDRIAAIEDKAIAAGALAGYVFRSTFRRGTERDQARNELLDAAESLIGDPNLPRTEAMHLRLQRVLDYLEEWSG